MKKLLLHTLLRHIVNVVAQSKIADFVPTFVTDRSEFVFYRRVGIFELHIFAVTNKHSNKIFDKDK